MRRQTLREKHKAPFSLQKLMAEATWARALTIITGTFLLLAALATAALFFTPLGPLAAIPAAIIATVVSQTTLFAALTALAGTLGIATIYGGSKLPTVQVELPRRKISDGPLTSTNPYPLAIAAAGRNPLASAAAADGTPSPGADEMSAHPLPMARITRKVSEPDSQPLAGAEEAEGLLITGIAAPGSSAN